MVMEGPPRIYVAAMSGVRKPFLPVELVIRSPLDNNLDKIWGVVGLIRRTIRRVGARVVEIMAT